MLRNLCIIADGPILAVTDLGVNGQIRYGTKLCQNPLHTIHTPTDRAKICASVHGETCVIHSGHSSFKERAGGVIICLGTTVSDQAEISESVWFWWKCQVVVNLVFIATFCNDVIEGHVLNALDHMRMINSIYRQPNMQHFRVDPNFDEK